MQIILVRLLIVGKKKLLIDGMEIGLDAPAQISYLSHAHSDHVFSADETICSKETAELLGLKKWKKEFKKNNLKISLHSAGHILGATQILVENGERFVYTGDFKLKKDVFGLKGEIIKCDELMIESTYGGEEWVFPSKELIYEEMCDWVIQSIENKESIIFGAYVLGKGQEIVKVLNNAGIIPLVHPKIEEICRIYEKNGFKLERNVLGSEKANKLLNETFVSILPQSMVNKDLARYISHESGKKIKTAVASGWCSRFCRNVDKSFVLSDHADFTEILDYVKKSGANKIYCCHGQNKKLADNLCNMGYDAVAI